MKIIECFDHYMSFTATKISRAEFEKNLSEKLMDDSFTQDILPLLPHTVNSSYDPTAEVKIIQDKIISCLPGEAWKKQTK